MYLTCLHVRVKAKHLTEGVGSGLSSQNLPGTCVMYSNRYNPLRTESKFCPVCLSHFCHQSKLVWFWSISTDHLLCFKVGVFF